MTPLSSMNWLRPIGAAVALASAAMAAPAASVHVVFDNPIFSGVPAPAYDAVTITYPALGTGAPRTVSTAAGRFQGTGSNVVGVSPSIFTDSLDDLYMYCYDVYEAVGSGWSVDYTINLDGERNRTLDFLGAVNAVLHGSQPGEDPYAWLHPTSGAMAAAIQLGIWESKYEAAGWSLASGSFSAGGVDSGTQTWLNTFFAAIDGSASLDGRYVMTLESAGVQDMITGDPPASVPEPGIAGLLALAAGGALWARRRHASAASAA